MPRDEMDEFDLEDEEEEEEDDLDDLDDDEEDDQDDLDDDEEDDEDADEEPAPPPASKAGLVTEEEGWEVVDLDEEDEDEEEEDTESEDADEDEDEDEEDEDVDAIGGDEQALLEQPKHRISATEQKKGSHSDADARKSAASAAGSTTNSRLTRNIKTRVGKRTAPRSNRRVHAAKLENKPNPSLPTAGLTPKSRSLNKRTSSSRRK